MDDQLRVLNSRDFPLNEVNCVDHPHTPTTNHFISFGLPTYQFKNADEPPGKSPLVVLPLPHESLLLVDPVGLQR